MGIAFVGLSARQTLHFNRTICAIENLSQRLAPQPVSF